MCIFNVKYTNDQFQDHETLKITLIQQLVFKKGRIALDFLYLSYFTDSYCETQPAGILTLRRIYIFIPFLYCISFLVNPSIFTLPNLCCWFGKLLKSVLPKVTNVLIQLTFRLAMDR